MSVKYIRGYDNFVSENVSLEVPKAVRELTAGRMCKLIDDTGDDFGIISAYKTGEGAHEAMKRLDRIEKELLRKKFGYIEITGGYAYPDKDGGQKSEGTRIDQTLLFIPKITLEDLISLAKEHSLETVAWGNKEKVTTYRTANRVATMSLTASDRQIGWVTLLFPPENE